MKLKRVLSLLLAMVMTVSLLTLPVHAEGNDFASLTVAEQYAALKSADNEAEAQALFDTLTEQQQTALVTYAQTQAEQEYTVPQTVVFTEAGPFMPPVNVAPVRMKAMARVAAVPAEDDGKGLVFTKKATDNGNGTYTITMEAYTTGEVTTSTKTVPVDIVLVLDQSGSMAYDFKGNSTRNNSDRRQYAMKQAVNNFIDKVNEKYSAEADHRMAIVTFGSDASTLQGWTFVNAAGKSTLKDRITGLPDSPEGGTQTDDGMELAKNLIIGNNYSYQGPNTDRQKVVIVFTDGVPGDSGFDIGVANAAIASAKGIKDAGATVYTVGIFTGANPEELYGSDSAQFDPTSDGSVGSIWRSKNSRIFLSGIFGGVYPEDAPAGNRFLNYLSSNFASAENVGLENNQEYAGWGFFYYGYKISYNYQNTGNGYYLTADNSTSLKEIFQTISQNIQTANINLGSETVIKDEISPYFTTPAEGEINLYTADYDGSQFGARKNAVGVKPTVVGDTVSVTGFNFNDNFVSDKVKSDGTYGKKLIIEFTVTPKDGFLGGNNVPTNVKAAVYDKGVTEVEAVGSPTVNVPIDDVAVTAANKNVYLLGGLTAAQLKEGAMVKVGDVTLNLAADATNYGLEAWQTEYVNITVTVKDKDGNVITTDLTDLTDDTTYTISVTVKPKTNGEGAEGTPATAKSGANNPAANIHVFKPELTFKDSTAYYGETVPANNDYSGNRVGAEKWMHDGTEAVLSEMLGTKPTLDISYMPDTNKIADGKYTKQDVPVSATVKIDGEDVTSYTTFLHEGCNSTCGWTEPTSGGNPAFLLHVNTCTLTVEKSGWDNKDANQSFIFNVTGGAINQEIKVTVQGNDSVTIVGLPVGNYTVTEDGMWSWRYTANGEGSATLSAEKPADTVTINNTRTATKWLSGDNYAVNYVDITKAQGTFVSGK